MGRNHQLHYPVANNKPKPKMNHRTVEVKVKAKTSLNHQRKKPITLKPQPAAISQHQSVRKRCHQKHNHC
jgi:hypothetical protein